MCSMGVGYCKDSQCHSLIPELNITILEYYKNWQFKCGYKFILFAASRSYYAKQSISPLFIKYMESIIMCSMGVGH